MVTIKTLKKEVEGGDNETVHIMYDVLIERRLHKLDPNFVKELKKIVEDINFWYA